MKKVKRWRYYCDHCKKSGGSEFHMINHEKVCTANPNRVCGMCEIAGLKQKSSAELIKFMQENILQECEQFGGSDNRERHLFYELKGFFFSDWRRTKLEKLEAELLKKLSEFVGGCPACMLSAMRLTKSVSCFYLFKWEEARDLFLSQHQRENYYETIG